MSAAGPPEREPDWLLQTLQSAVHHARRDISEETLMRLAQDSLLLSDYLENRESGRDACRVVTTARHRLALDVPPSARGGHSKDPTRQKLDSYRQARMTQGTGLFAEAFVAGEDDRRLALDATGAELSSPQRGPHKTGIVCLAAAGIILLFLLLLLSAID